MTATDIAAVFLLAVGAVGVVCIAAVLVEAWLDSVLDDGEDMP